MIAVRAAKIRRLASKKGVSVLFYTDHYKEERLHELAKNMNIFNRDSTGKSVAMVGL